MKKLSIALKQFQARSASREAAARENRKGRGADYGDRIRAHEAAAGVQPNLPGSWAPWEEVVLEGELSAQDNPRNCVDQLRAFSLLQGKTGAFNVHVDMSRLTKIDAGALVMLCAGIKGIRSRGKGHVFTISGNYPSDEGPRKTLADAGFAAFIVARSAQSIIRGKNPIARLIKMEGRHEARPVAIEISNFLLDKLSEEEQRKRKTDAFYLTVHECVENIFLHAYEETNTKSTWYVLGKYDPSTQTSSVAIYDVGPGIASTIKNNRKWIEAITDIVLMKDCDLVREAILGRRTETNERKRGKGLSSLLYFVTETPGMRLDVLSSRYMTTALPNPLPVGQERDASMLLSEQIDPRISQVDVHTPSRGTLVIVSVCHAVPALEGSDTYD